MEPMATRILIVDDDFDVIKQVGLFLDGQGYEIVPAQSGQEALQKAVEAQADLILLDINLPDIDGYEVCQQLRARSETADVPIVMFTSLRSVDDRVKGFSAGADDFITKPIHPAELQARLRAVLVRSTRREPVPEKRACVIGFLGAKGGVGTTTVAVNAAAGLLKQSAGDVMLADLGPGSGSLALYLRLRPGRGGIQRLLSQPAKDITGRMIELELASHPSGLRVLPGQLAPMGAAAALTSEHMRVVLDQLGGMCDWLVLDLGMGLSEATRCALKRCDHVVLVTEPDAITMRLVEELLNLLVRDVGVERHNVSAGVVNRAAATEITALADLEDELGISIAGIVSMNADLVREATRRGVALVDAYPNSPVGNQLARVAAYLAEV
jgi:DNA-binding response OmpR family regulator